MQPCAAEKVCAGDRDGRPTLRCSCSSRARDPWPAIGRDGGTVRRDRSRTCDQGCCLMVISGRISTARCSVQRAALPSYTSSCCWAGPADTVGRHRACKCRACWRFLVLRAAAAKSWSSSRILAGHCGQRTLTINNNVTRCAWHATLKASCSTYVLCMPGVNSNLLQVQELDLPMTCS